MDPIYDVIIEETSRFEKNFDKLPLQVAKHFRQQTLPAIVACIRGQNPFSKSLRAKYVEGSNSSVWEATINMSFRVTFSLLNEYDPENSLIVVIQLRNVGPHEVVFRPPY
jgi:mRNA-degrading endonuclease YafQ of YafQ-DinJ toxin-antitoxin module